MAEQQKDPYQYERILRRKVQQTLSEQKEPAEQPAGGKAPDPTQELMNSIGELGKVIAQEVGGALGDAAREVSRNAARKTAQHSQARQAARRAGDAVASEVNRAAANLSSGLRDGLCIFGGTLAVCCAVATGLMALTAVLSLMFYFDIAGLIALLLVLGVTVALCFAARWAFSQPARRARLRRYLAAMGSDRSVPLQRMAEAVRRPVSFVKKDLDRMIRQGWLHDSFLDDEENRFFISAAEYRTLQRRQEAAERAAAQPGTAGELAELLQQCDDFDLLLNEHIRSTADQPELCSQLQHLQTTAAAIADWVRAHPQSTGKVRKFARYYMPTTLKLLRAYDDVRHQRGQAADNIRQEIGGILTTLNTAFDNLRNDLLSDTALDISSEISAMQAMLAQDGLAEYSTLQKE